MKCDKYFYSTLSNEMKFNAVVGNPPYQEEGTNTRKSPIYNHFYDLAFKLSDRATLITPGRFLFRAGQTPKQWTDAILNDEYFKVPRFYVQSTDVFPPPIDIKGGIAIGFRDATIRCGKIGLFLAHSELYSIYNKVSTHPNYTEGEFTEIVSPQGVYKFTDLVFEDYPITSEVQGKGTGAKITSKSFSALTEIFTEKKNTENSLHFIGRDEKGRKKKWIKKEYICPCDLLNTYRVLVPAANGSGAIGEVLSTPIIGHTDTFLSIGSFTTRHEANACLKYIKTKFARTMLGCLKVTQGNLRETWRFVPLQDFTSASDIDWSKSVAEIDAQLYAKYGLSEEDIAFIETNIKPMD